jgi:hypothetical protein
MAGHGRKPEAGHTMPQDLALIAPPLRQPLSQYVGVTARIMSSTSIVFLDHVYATNAR